MGLFDSAKKRAEEAIRTAITRAERVITLQDPTGRLAQRELTAVMEAADRRVAKRLAVLAGRNMGATFSTAQATAYQAQIRTTIDLVRGKASELGIGVARAAAGRSIDGAVALVTKLEETYRGVAHVPSVKAAVQQSHALHGYDAQLSTRFSTSFDRYGITMSREFAQIMQAGLASGATVDQMVAELVTHKGPAGRVSLMARKDAQGIVQRIREDDIPEGLFVRHRYWAERIVRTETSYAYNGAKVDTIREMNRAGLGMRKKIVAVFDARTAPDSIAVHGQVREVDDTFLDGAGRSYLYPPARPNDRETIIPWDPRWPETESTRPAPEAEREEARAEATRAGPV